MTDIKEYSFQELKELSKKKLLFLRAQYKLLLISGVIFGLVGFGISLLVPCVYVCKIRFVNEVQKSPGMALPSIASIILGSGSNSGNAYEGDNIGYILQSESLIRSTLFAFSSKTGKPLLSVYMSESLKEQEIKNSTDSNGQIKTIINKIKENLSFYQEDKKLNISIIEFRSENELFAKEFLAELMKQATLQYKNYVTAKSLYYYKGVEKVADSLKQVLQDGLNQSANRADNAINANKQIAKVPQQFSTIMYQNNIQLLQELNKQLQAAKLNLLRQTPLVNIIDDIVLPLEKRELSKLWTSLFCALIGSLFFLTIKNKSEFS